MNLAIRDGSLFENPALVACVRARARARRATSTCSGSSRTAASTRTSITCRRCSSSRAARDGGAHLDPRLHRRARRLADRRPCPTSPSCRPSGSRPSSAATTRWTATSAGAHAARVRRDHRRRRGRSAARPPVEDVQASYDAGRHRRVPRADRRRRRAARSARRRGDLLQLPARPRPPARGEARSRRAST